MTRSQRSIKEPSSLVLIDFYALVVSRSKLEGSVQHRLAKLLLRFGRAISRPPKNFQSTTNECKRYPLDLIERGVIEVSANLSQTSQVVLQQNSMKGVCMIFRMRCAPRLGNNVCMYIYENHI